MRRAFVDTLAELADGDDRIVLLTGDLGFSVVEPFAERFPERFFNAGVAEQNMVGVATGLAEAGLVPFAYSIATFLTMRPYEFIRNGPVMQRLPVRLVGVGGGLEYGHNGSSHYALEDVALFRPHTGLQVVVPADHRQARAALRATWDAPGPVYFRLGKDETAELEGLDGSWEAGRAHRLGDGRDVLIVALGAVALEGAEAVRRLADEGVGASLLVVSSVSPPPVDDLAAALREFGHAVTVEEHFVAGGLGSLVAEVTAEHGLGCRLTRCGVRDLPHGLSGPHDAVRRLHGLTADRVAEAALACLR